MTKLARGGALVFVVALTARLAIVAWAASRIPVAADGVYYHELARRLAAGAGYTWQWPDGAVTYAAHYPVGYPAILAVAYAAFGSSPGVAMLVNSLIGAFGAWATFDLVSRVTGRRRGIAAGFVMALHPALVPYTAAVMTEGVTAALLVAAAALACRARMGRGSARAWAGVGLGLVLGIATLVRPQSLALAPVFGWLACDRPRDALRGALVVTAIALAVCAPWTARNCARMDRCALVSVNGGWNLAIGAQTTDGAWRELAVPPECREVWSEAGKDACFGREARREIVRAPWRWLSRAPAKVRATFDYFGAAPWYLHVANPGAFSARAKVLWGAAETLASRVLLAAALVGLAKAKGPLPRIRAAVVAVGLVGCVTRAGSVGYFACVLVVGVLATDRDLRRRPGFALLAASASALAVTAVTHAVFFGAGRYGLVMVPFVAALAAAARTASECGCEEAEEAAGWAASMPSRRSPADVALLAPQRREESPGSVECDAG